MTTDYFAMPNELPEKPAGWTRKFVMHLNFGSKQGGVCSYEILDGNGRSMPFAYQSSAKQGTGFILPGVAPLLSWKDLREIWPKWILKARNKQTSRSLESTSEQPRRVEPFTSKGEHLPKSTIETTAYCNRCLKHTQHRVDGGRIGPCLDCLKKREVEAEASRIKRGMDKEAKEAYDRQNPKLF